MKYIITSILCLSLSCAVVFANRAAKQRIHHSALNTTHTIIGPLGLPLGTVCTVEAKVVSPQPRKGAQNWLEIHTVNQKKLKTPVMVTYTRFRWGIRQKLQPGKSYTLRVYQDGGMVGIPHQAMKETVFVQTVSYHFRVTIVVLKAL